MIHVAHNAEAVDISSQPFVVFGLLQHESKVYVIIVGSPSSTLKNLHVYIHIFKLIFNMLNPSTLDSIGFHTNVYGVVYLRPSKTCWISTTLPVSDLFSVFPLFSLSLFPCSSDTPLLLVFPLYPGKGYRGNKGREWALGTVRSLGHENREGATVSTGSSGGLREH